MADIMSLVFSGAASDRGSQWHLAVSIKHHKDVVCTGKINFPAPIPSCPMVPLLWVQSVLLYAVEELDAAEFVVEHGEGCPSRKEKANAS